MKRNACERVSLFQHYRYNCNFTFPRQHREFPQHITEQYGEGYGGVVPASREEESTSTVAPNQEGRPKMRSAAPYESNASSLHAQDAKSKGAT